MKSPDKKNRFFSSDFFPVVLIVVYVAILMFPFTFGGKSLMPDTWKAIHPWARGVDINQNQTSIYDTVLEYEPWFRYSQECLKEGRVPHWNPWQFCGTPLYANRLVPFFYPPFILSLLISSPEKIIGWFQFINLILSGWGMFFLLRRWDKSRWVSLSGSLLFLTAGFHFLPFPLWVLGISGFPWLLWSLEGYLKKPGFLHIGTGSAIAGCILMTGYPVLIVHMSYFVVLYFLLRYWFGSKNDFVKGHWITPAFVLAAIFIIGFGISSIANIPAYQYSKETVRALEGFSDRAFETEKKRLLEIPDNGDSPVIARFGDKADILFPVNGRGNQRAWQYGGILLYFLALLGILNFNRRTILLSFLWLLFGILVVFPEVYLILIEYLPGWAVTIFLPVEVVNFIACLLAANGIEMLSGEKKLSLVPRIIFSLTGIFSIVFTYLSLKNAPVINLSYLGTVKQPDLLGNSPFHLMYFIATSILIGLMVIVTVFDFRARYNRWGLIILAIIFSVYVFHYLQPVWSNSGYEPETRFTGLISDEISGSKIGEAGRFSRWAELPMPFSPHRRAKSPFTPNVHMRYKTMEVGGYDSLVPKRYILYCTLFEDPFIDYRALIAFRNPFTLNHQWFRNFAVRYIITQGELPVEAQEGCRKIYDDRDFLNSGKKIESDDFMQVWEIENPAPRAFLTRKISFHSHPFDDAVVQLANWRAKSLDMVVVEDATKENRSLAFPVDTSINEPLILEQSRVEFISDKPEYVSFEVIAPDECYLVLRDGYFHEWEARIDGEKTEIYPADKAFRAVKIPEGKHIVEFIYNPTGFKQGAMISVISLLISLGLIFRGFARRRD